MHTSPFPVKAAHSRWSLTLSRDGNIFMPQLLWRWFCFFNNLILWTTRFSILTLYSHLTSSKTYSILKWEATSHYSIGLCQGTVILGGRDPPLDLLRQTDKLFVMKSHNLFNRGQSYKNILIQALSVCTRFSLFAFVCGELTIKDDSVIKALLMNRVERYCFINCLHVMFHLSTCILGTIVH